MYYVQLRTLTLCLNKVPDILLTYVGSTPRFVVQDTHQSEDTSTIGLSFVSRTTIPCRRFKL